MLSALGAYFLAYTLTRRHDAAFVAGIAYAFAPYRLAQVPHIQVLSAYWAPVCLAALHRYDRDPRPRWAILAAGAWLMQALSCGYYMFFLSVLLALWMLWFAPGRWSLRTIGGAALAFGVAALLLAPILLDYQAILRDTYGFSRSIDEIRIFSADVAGLLLASEDLLLWGWLHVIQRPESALFPGLTIVLLAGFALYSTRPFDTDAGEWRRMRVLRGALTAILVVLLIAAAIPIAYGRAWRLTVGGVRLISMARADRPLALALAAALALMASLPRVRAAFRRRSPLAFYLIATFAMWVFALGPDPTFMDHRALYPSALRMADAAARLRRAARACPVLDDGARLSQRGGGACRQAALGAHPPDRRRARLAGAAPRRVAPDVHRGAGAADSAVSCGRDEPDRSSDL